MTDRITFSANVVCKCQIPLYGPDRTGHDQTKSADFVGDLEFVFKYCVARSCGFRSVGCRRRQLQLPYRWATEHIRSVRYAPALRQG